MTRALILLLSTVVAMNSSDPMAVEIQQELDEISAKTGNSYIFGYVDEEKELAMGAGPRTPPELVVGEFVDGDINGHDTGIMGSGTKAFTAAAIMRLFDQGKLHLDDPAMNYIDPPMKRMWNTTFVELFGERAKQVTVRHLVYMRSGINDFEGAIINGTNFDKYYLYNISTEEVSPLGNLLAVAHLEGEDFCNNGQCTWYAEPGEEGHYSTTNYILNGVILLNFAPEGKNDWKTFDLGEALGLNRSVYKDIKFPSYGVSNKVGLTVPGDTKGFGPDEQVWRQDHSIESWTGGYAISSAIDVARFFWDLLGPKRSILSEDTYKEALDFGDISLGLIHYPYGAGLMVGNTNITKVKGRVPKDPESPTGYVGHNGATYGFRSSNGFFKSINASISLIVNSDYDQI